MTWNGTKTWTPGEKARSTDLNDHVSENLDYLFERPRAAVRIDKGSNYTTNSTTFVDVDNVDFSLSLTTSGGDLLVVATGLNLKFSAFNFALFDISVDGTRQGLDDGILRLGQGDSANGDSAPLIWLVQDLAAGPHTIKLQWKRSANQTGSITLYAGAGTSDADTHPQFFALEV